MNLKVATPEQQASRERADDAASASRVDAAKKFEAVLMHQLLSVMRQSAKSGGMNGTEGASGQYTAMFDEAIADKMAEGGGIGLAGALIEAMGGQREDLRQNNLPKTGPAMGMPSSSGGLVQSQAAAVSAPLPGLNGATAKLAQAAYAISAPDGGKQWSRQGTLTERDLASKVETQTASGIARFAVKDAQGYRDAYKCNLFAFEAARRAGFEVPVINRDRGYGFPTSNTVTEDAQDGALRGDWATVVPNTQLADLQAKLARGEVAVMLTGSGQDGHHGHMAVVEKIHDIQLDEHGEVERIEFDGYEARVDGAQHLTKRSWNRVGHGEDSKLARNGFEKIELLALRPADKPQAPEIRLSDGVRPSGHKAP
ncbi:MAG: rane protein metalloendopeptidase-like protein [Myxococcaceae bacterium]|nr:rane protein metalloendopeptidase-like protein [Myxococcaceae bacterium]